MKKRPLTLLGRTAVALGILMVLSFVLWMASALAFLILPIKQVQLGNITAVVVLARELVTAEPAKERFELLENYRIVTDAEPKPALTLESYGYVPDLQELLLKSMGPDIIVFREYEENTLWIQFVANDRKYWVIIPKAMPPLPGYILATVGTVIAVSLLGAYLIIFSTTKELRKVTAAVRHLGRGNTEVVLAEIGPREIQDLSRGFNQMAADLRKLDDDRRLMLAGISHDLKTPLSQLRIAVELAATRADPEVAAGMIYDIEDMDAILKQFLDYARDGAEESLSLQNLNELVREICERYQLRGIKLTTTLGAVPPFRFRRLAMSRAISNLIDNAVRYGRDGIEIATQSVNGAAEFVVADAGPGIQSGAPTDYIRAFARENTARSEAGAGLGLTIVNRIVQLHAGELQIENRKPTGLLVRIRIPQFPEG